VDIYKQTSTHNVWRSGMLSKRPAGNDVIALKQMFLQSKHLSQHVVGSETASKCRINTYFWLKNLLQENKQECQRNKIVKNMRRKHGDLVAQKSAKHIINDWD
jgi:hypothetical protein